MKTNKAHDLTKWSFSDQDRVLPDANFWINIFGPSATTAQRAHFSAAYSRAFQTMLSQKVCLYIDVLILSEFVNVLARQEFNLKFIQTYGSRGFKNFRNSANFIPTAKMIASETRKILKYSNQLDHTFTEWDTQQLMADFELGGEDLNDQLIIEMAKKYDLIILTDDKDMTKGGLQILTANTNLLKSCPC